MRSLFKSSVIALSVLSAGALSAAPASAYGYKYGHSSYSYKQYCSAWGWCGHGYNKYRCCKSWSHH